MTGPGIAYYEDAPEGSGAITIHAAVQVSAPLQDGNRTAGDLPGRPGGPGVIIHTALLLAPGDRSTWLVDHMVDLDETTGTDTKAVRTALARN